MRHLGAKVSMDDFINEIIKLKNEYKEDGQSQMTLRSGDLQKMIGVHNYPQMACRAMRECMELKDQEIAWPQKRDGSGPAEYGNNLVVLYFL